MTQTLESIVREFFDVIQYTNAPGTVANYKRHIYAWMKTVEGKTLEELRPIHLLRWGHTWHQIQAIQRLFGWAVDEAELITRHPFRKVKKPPIGERKRTVPRKQFLLLCRTAGRPFRDYLLCLRETIARPQEVRGLGWEQLRAASEGEHVLDACLSGRACFVLDEYKARKRRKDPSKPRVLLVSRRLGRLLVRLARQRDGLAGPIFLNTKGSAWTTNAVRLRMRSLRRKLKLGPDARGENIVAYSIRHTQATAAAAAGVRDRILAEIMGHTSTRTTARYQHLELDHLRAAFDRVNARPAPC